MRLISFNEKNIESRSPFYPCNRNYETYQYVYGDDKI